MNTLLHRNCEHTAQRTRATAEDVMHLLCSQGFTKATQDRLYSYRCCGEYSIYVSVSVDCIYWSPPISMSITYRSPTRTLVTTIDSDGFASGEEYLRFIESAVVDRMMSWGAYLQYLIISGE